MLRWGRPYCPGPPVAPPVMSEVAAACSWVHFGCCVLADGAVATYEGCAFGLVAGHKCPEVLGGAGLRHHLLEAPAGLHEEGHRLLAG